MVRIILFLIVFYEETILAYLSLKKEEKKRFEKCLNLGEGKIVHSHAYIYRRLMVVDNELVELLSVYSNK